MASEQLEKNPEYQGLLCGYLETIPVAATGLTNLDEERFFERRQSLDAVASVITPHDVDEDPYMLCSTLGTLNKAAWPGGKVEVVVGVNGAWDVKDKEIGRQVSRYEELVSYIRADRIFPKNNLLLRLFRMHIPDRTMNRVTVRCLKSVVTDSLLLGRPPNFPVLRFDSDGTYLSKGSIPAMSEAIRQGEAHLIKAPTVFGHPKYRRRRGVSEYTPAEKIARLYGIVKTVIEETLGPYEERTYHEESGSGAQLQAWARFLMDLRTTDPHGVSDEGENKLFLRFARSELDPDVPPVMYLPPTQALHGTSYRRMARLAIHHPAWQIPLLEDGEDYQTFNGMKNSDNTAERRVRSTTEDLALMVGVMLLRQEAVIGRRVELTRQQISHIGEILVRCLPWQKGTSIRLRRNWTEDARAKAEDHISQLQAA